MFGLGRCLSVCPGGTDGCSSGASEGGERGVGNTHPGSGERTAAPRAHTHTGKTRGAAGPNPTPDAAKYTQLNWK